MLLLKTQNSPRPKRKKVLERKMLCTRQYKIRLSSNGPGTAFNLITHWLCEFGEMTSGVLVSSFEKGDTFCKVKGISHKIVLRIKYENVCKFLGLVHLYISGEYSLLL